jgi:hypothetical protein
MGSWRSCCVDDWTCFCPESVLWFAHRLENLEWSGYRKLDSREWRSESGRWCSSQEVFGSRCFGGCCRLRTGCSDCRRNCKRLSYFAIFNVEVARTLCRSLVDALSSSMDWIPLIRVRDSLGLEVSGAAPEDSAGHQLEKKRWFYSWYFGGLQVAQRHLEERNHLWLVGSLLLCLWRDLERSDFMKWCRTSHSIGRF